MIKNRHLLIKDNLLILEGEITKDDFTGGEKILARNLYSIDQYRLQFAKALILNFNCNDQAELNQKKPAISSLFYLSIKTAAVLFTLITVISIYRRVLN